jgi:hypothetical protein
MHKMVGEMVAFFFFAFRNLGAFGRTLLSFLIPGKKVWGIGGFMDGAFA